MLIGICGRAGSGKTTVADILVSRHGFVSVALADPIKRYCRDAFDFTYEQLWGPSSARNAPDLRFLREHTSSALAGGCTCCGVDLWNYDEADKPCYLTPRHALQQLGTEWGRRCYSDVWINYALRVAKEILEGAEYYPTRGTTVEKAEVRASGVVISDVRFPNEVAALRKAGGKIWKTTHGEGLKGSAGGHSSEGYIDELEVDAIFSSELELEDLPKAVEIFLKETVPEEPYKLADNRKAQEQGHLTRKS